MLNFNLAAVQGSCIVLRSRTGALAGGMPALLHACAALAVFGGMLTLARGFFADSLPGRLLEVPIAWPLMMLMVLLTAVWCVRSAGLTTRWHGPPRAEAVDDGFTGDPAPWWKRWLPDASDWTLMERSEPALLSMLGLLLIPWTPTRAVGLVLLLAAWSLSLQAMLDRRHNLSSDTASVIPPLPINVGEIPHHTAMIPLLPEELFNVMDEPTRETHAVARKQAESMPEPSFFRRTSAEPPRGKDTEERAPESVRITPGFLALVLTLFLLVAANFAAADPVGLYRFAPDRWTNSVKSLETELAVFNLADPPGRYRLGTLSDPFLARVAPSAHAEWYNAALGRAEEDAGSMFALVEDHIDLVKELFQGAAGLELQPGVSSAEFNAIILAHFSVAESWSWLLQYVHTAQESLGHARDVLGKTETSSVRLRIETLVTVAAELEAIAHSTSDAIPHIRHVRTMRELYLIDFAQQGRKAEEPSA